ncbi:hypothetical protein [Nocardia araoensis]|uniref:hypothetical protein n=1 Tax=Nocardia araoensis TaxID=228600 RepID=UPI0002DFCFDB|nr:hypothetical protein [Nocardia araoensis]
MGNANANNSMSPLGVFAAAWYGGDYPGGVRISDDLAALGRGYINSPNKQWIETLQAHVDGPIPGGAPYLHINHRRLDQPNPNVAELEKGISARERL